MLNATNDANWTQDRNLKNAKIFETRVFELRLCGTIGLASAGFVLNILSVSVFRSARLRQRPYVQILTLLALLNNVVLVYELLDVCYVPVYKRWHLALIAQGSDVACKLFLFTRKTIYVVVSWLMIMLCAQRMVVLYWPLRRPTGWTSTVTWTLALAVTLVAAVLNTWELFLSHAASPLRLAYDPCSQSRLDVFWRSVYHQLHTFLFLPMAYYVPAVVISVTNALVVFKIRLSSRSAIRRAVRRPSVNGARRLADSPSGSSGHLRGASSGTITLLYLTSMYILVCVPIIVITSYISIYPNALREQPLLYDIVHLTELLKVVNYADGFIIYVLSGRKFRGEFWRIMRCRKKDTIGLPHSAIVKDRTHLRDRTSFCHDVVEKVERLSEANQELLHLLVREGALKAAARRSSAMEGSSVAPGESEHLRSNTAV